MRPLNVWIHLKVQVATSLLVLSLHPGAENALNPSGPSKLELSSRAVTALNLSNSHSGKSNTPRTTNTWLVCSAFWKKDQRSLSVFHKCGSLAEFRFDTGLSSLWWQTALEMTDIKITACWRNDCQETCCFWSRGAPGPGPWGACSCAGGPPSSLPFHVFLGAASNVKATALCFCMPKSAHNTKEKFFLPFFPKCSCVHETPP